MDFCKHCYQLRSSIVFFGFKVNYFCNEGKMYYSPFTVTFTPSLFIPMQLLCKSVLFSFSFFFLSPFILKAYMRIIWPRLYVSSTAYGWGKEHRIFCSTVFVFLSSLLLPWSSNKANYKEKKKKGGTGGEGAFKTIPFAAWNKREYQGHG